MTDQEVLDVHAAAALLKVPVSVVYGLASKGWIPARKVGRHWRFRKDAVLGWLLTTGLGGRRKP